MTNDEAQRLVDKAAHDLGEHFESVHVFVTRCTEDGKSNTQALDCGCGNFYAQLGQVREWLQIQEQYQRNWAIRKDAEDEA